MDRFLAEFAATPAADEHAVPVLARAGRHGAKRLAVPSDVTLVRPPPHAPELNPAERVWSYSRERHFSHRPPDAYDAIADALRQARNALTAERLQGLTSYPYPEQVKV